MKVLFVYNDYNDVRGISNVMAVAERYAFSLDKGEFWVNTSNQPSIRFEDGTVISIAPVSHSLTGLDKYDKVYIDNSIETFMDTTRFSSKIETYNKDSFKS